MKFLFWLMNFKILAHEISTSNFYDTAAQIAKRIDSQWQWRKQELITLYNRLKKFENSQKSVLLPKMYILLKFLSREFFLLSEEFPDVRLRE